MGEGMRRAQVWGIPWAEVLAIINKYDIILLEFMKKMRDMDNHPHSWIEGGNTSLRGVVALLGVFVVLLNVHLSLTLPSGGVLGAMGVENLPAQRLAKLQAEIAGVIDSLERTRAPVESEVSSSPMDHREVLSLAPDFVRRIGESLEPILPALDALRLVAFNGRSGQLVLEGVLQHPVGQRRSAYQRVVDALLATGTVARVDVHAPDAGVREGGRASSFTLRLTYDRSLSPASSR